MNNESLRDPELLELEASLAYRRPQVAPQHKDQLLFACAYAAGKNRAAQSLHFWKSATAVSFAMFVAASVPSFLGSHENEVARIETQVIEQSPPVEQERPLNQTSLDLPQFVRKPTITNLDAWQRPAPARDSLEYQLAQLEQADTHQKSLTISRLTLAILNP